VPGRHGGRSTPKNRYRPRPLQKNKGSYLNQQFTAMHIVVVSARLRGNCRVRCVSTARRGNGATSHSEPERRVHERDESTGVPRSTWSRRRGDPGIGRLGTSGRARRGTRGIPATGPRRVSDVRPADHRGARDRPGAEIVR
jgi:hypothetical protein